MAADAGGCSTSRRKRKLQTQPNHSPIITTSNSNKHGDFKKRRRKKFHDRRKWVFSNRSVSDSDSSSYKDKFVFVSYNILGVENAANHKDLYVNVLPKFMNWEHRRKVIRNEIARYNPSILCFQEVDRFDDLNSILQKDGFIGVYQARTGEACDGCAIFWKDESFSLLHEENIEFKRFGLRDNVAQFCVLEMNPKDIDDSENLKAEPSRRIVVGNIHVLFNPSRGDIKLGQVRLYLAKAHGLSQTWGKIPVILGGDFNSMPQSAMYEFIASSELDIQHHQRKNISGQICPLDYPRVQFRSNYFSRWSKQELMLATGTESTYLSHNLNLKSAYHEVPASRLTRDSHGEPLATSFHSRFMGTVDFIWHTEDLVPVKVLETLPLGILKKTGGLPSKIWGSDHLALVCELAFAGDSCET
ncbi:carbon catabolite repressor protein 4 homolog 5 [Rutidosis leptorrhynchoides]|uniref:carbon catabolite repressor protein 4 homolog 5 n=1 Tax=Rutidosis leptorrhynchoides TaxID=125765 RepID=UPI003A9A0923